MRILQYIGCGRNVDCNYQYRIESTAKLSPNIAKPPFKKEYVQEHKARTLL